MAELRKSAGTQFDPVIVDVLCALVERMGESILEVPESGLGLESLEKEIQQQLAIEQATHGA